MGPSRTLAEIQPYLTSLNSESGRVQNPLPGILVEIIREIFTYLLESPQTITSVVASCWTFRQIITSHLFIVLAHSIYRLARAKKEEIPHLVIFCQRLIPVSCNKF